MANEDNEGGFSPDSSRPRPAPTIDLKATEIAREQAAAAGGKDGSNNDVSDDRNSGPQEHLQAPASSETGGWNWRVPALVAAAIGIPLFGLGLWLGEMVTRRDGDRAQIESRLARVETVLSQPPAPDIPLRQTAENLTALGRRVDDISNSLRELRARIDAVAMSADAAQKATGGAPPQVSSAEIAEMSGKIAALEQSLKARENEIATRLAAGADDRSGRRAVAATALQSAVERGDPFVDQLAAAKMLASDTAVLASLEVFAATGVPSNNSLGRELSGIVQSISKILGEQQPQQGGILEKFQTSAERLVRIRPLGETQGDEPAAVVSRLELKAARSDIRGALEDIAKLPANLRAPAEAWIRKVQTRDAALAASRKFAADTLSALGKPAL